MSATIAHLLRIEAVNLDTVLEDTDQLSVIRGGGLMALEAVGGFAGKPVPLPPARWTRWLPFLRRWLGRTTQAELISGGASVGLYRLQLPPDPSAEPHRELVAHVAARLAEDYPHHCFVVDLEPFPDGADEFKSARERVIAKNRLRQLQQPSLALPEIDASPHGPCARDDLRPAAAAQHLRRTALGTRPGKLWLSPSVFERYRCGRERKRGFLNDLVAPRLGRALDYTEDFEQLAGDFPQDRRLQNKLAVLYFDGNDFGKHQSRCDSPDVLQTFDQTLRDHRIRLLQDLIGHLAGRPDAFARPYDRAGKLDAAAEASALRFELLLWGGDELLFVVPAWLGLKALFTAWRSMAGWTWQDQPLTQAGALIFCDHKTPIDRMTALARELAERVKAHDRGAGRQENLFDYLILESIDFPAEPLRAYFARRYPGLAASRRPLAPVPAAATLIGELAARREHIPRGPLLEGVWRLLRDTDCDPQTSATALTDDLQRRAAASGAEAEQTLNSVLDHLAQLWPAQSLAWRLAHLAEWWDYLGPSTPASANTPTQAAQGVAPGDLR